MAPLMKKHLAAIVSAIAIVIIGIVWLVNGAELEDAWLYIVGVAIAATPLLDSLFRKQ